MTSIGIIGFGFMGRTHFAAYAADPRASVVAIADERPQRVRQPSSAGNIPGPSPSEAELKGITVYTSPQELLDDDNVEAVSICVPTVFHADLSIQALQRGKHVLIEKPMALTSEDAERVVTESARRPDQTCIPAMCMRHWPGWREARDAIADGRYGKVRFATFCRIGSQPHWGQEFYLDPAKSGGALIDLHIHDSDFVRYCFGDPCEVRSIGIAERGAVNHVITEYRFDDEWGGGPDVAVATGRWMPVREYPFDMRYLITFDRAALDFDIRRDPPLTIYHPDQPPEPVTLNGADGYGPQAKHFLDCIEQGRQSDIVTPADGAAAVRLIEAERESVLNRKPVTFTCRA